MVVPCWTVSHFIATPAARGVVHAAKAVLPYIHRHTVHRVHHAFHAATTHPGVWLETVCRAAPLAIASGILSVPVTAPIPVETTPPISVQPADASPRPSTYASVPVTQPILFGYGAGAGKAATPTGSTLVTLPQNEVPPTPTAAEILAPYAPKPQPIPGGSPSGPVAPDGGITEIQPVPEPSSLIILASGLAAVGLLRQRKRRA